MSEEKPEAEDRLGKDIEDSVSNDLGVKSNEAAAISDTPDAGNCQLAQMEPREGLHWVDGPEDQSEASNGTIESLGLAVLAGNSGAAVEGKLIDDDEEGNAGPGVPAPLLAVIVAESREETSQDHDEVGNHGNQNVGTTQTSEECKVHEEEWGSDAPVNISCPVDLAVVNLGCVWDVLVRLGFGDLVQANSVT